MRKVLLSTSAVLVLLTGGLSGCTDKAQDLDKVCQAFGQLSQHPELEKMGHGARMAFVSARIDDALSRFSAVAPLWEHVPYYEPSRSYPMFQRTAEELLGKPWTCPDMERLSPTLSEPIVEGRQHDVTGQAFRSPHRGMRRSKGPTPNHQRQADGWAPLLSLAQAIGV